MNALWRWKVIFCISGILLVSNLADGEKIPKGLHIERNRWTGFNRTIRDGAGQYWYIQRYLSVYGGINNIYAGGLQCYVDGTVVNSNGRGWINSAGDEIEIGPYRRNGYEVYRRCKVYRDRCLARWMDIFISKSAQRKRIKVRVYSNYNRPITQVITSSGNNKVSANDWAFITNHSGTAIAHIIRRKTSPFRASVSGANANSRRIYVDYTLDLPPYGIAIVCYFESGSTIPDSLKEMLKKFDPRSAMKDLPAEVRRLIINFREGSAAGEVFLIRNSRNDIVYLKNNDSISGTIMNKEYIIKTFFGQVKLPAEKVIGLATVPKKENTVRVVVKNGEIISGELTDPIIKLVLPIGGVLQIPIEKIRQCSYKISKDKPEQMHTTDSLVMLETGDVLAIEDDNLHLQLQRRSGKVELKSPYLREIFIKTEKNDVHRVEFINGSVLTGLILPETINIPLKSGKELKIPRDLICTFRFNNESPQNGEKLTSVDLANGDKLFGRIDDDVIGLETDFGKVSINPENISRMTFTHGEHSCKVAVTLWDGSILRGKITGCVIHFAIVPGPTVALHAGNIRTINRPFAVPPQGIIKQVEKYIALLSSPVYKDREEAQQALINMGSIVAPLLKKYLNDPDPEVRQRIRTILTKIGANPSQ